MVDVLEILLLDIEVAELVLLGGLEWSTSSVCRLSTNEKKENICKKIQSIAHRLQNTVDIKGICCRVPLGIVSIVIDAVNGLLSSIKTVNRKAGPTKNENP